MLFRQMHTLGIGLKRLVQKPKCLYIILKPITYLTDRLQQICHSNPSVTVALLCDSMSESGSITLLNLLPLPYSLLCSRSPPELM